MCAKLKKQITVKQLCPYELRNKKDSANNQFRIKKPQIAHFATLHLILETNVPFSFVSPPFKINHFHENAFRRISRTI